jgi:hypothetical protein
MKYAFGASMANFRVERARHRLFDAIDGVDLNANIDAEEFCWIDPTSIDANTCGVTPLSEFYAADFQGWREDDKCFLRTKDW